MSDNNDVDQSFSGVECWVCVCVLSQKTCVCHKTASIVAVTLLSYISISFLQQRITGAMRIKYPVQESVWNCVARLATSGCGEVRESIACIFVSTSIEHSDNTQVYSVTCSAPVLNQSPTQEISF